MDWVTDGIPIENSLDRFLQVLKYVATNFTPVY